MVAVKHPTGRFAPSPTGRMHLGNIYAALLSWLSVRSQGGEWILRIEDIDQGRSRREYADQIEDDLLWLGLHWDHHYRQSDRYDRYLQALHHLQSLGLVYPCYCTRADILASSAPHESDGRIVYPGTCRPPVSVSRSRSESRRPALRLIVPDEDIPFTDLHYGPSSTNLARHCGDYVIRRSDDSWAYQLAVVVDDAEMGVTEVVRGRDLLHSSPQQIHLHRLLGHTEPRFGHIPLLINPQGQRLSKRDQSLDMGHLRQRYTPEQLLGLLAFHAGLADSCAPITAQQLIPRFSWSSIPKGDITITL